MNDGKDKKVMKITDFMKRNNGVFKDTKVLSEGYIPDKFLFREDEISKIIRNINAYLDEIPPNNMFIYGPPSTGKTHILMAISNVLNEYSMKEGANSRYIYINTGKKTLPQVLVSIAESLGINAVINQGPSIFDRIKKKLNGNYFFIFDEFDRIEPTEGHSNPYNFIVNVFTRIGSNVRIACVLNDVKILKKFDDATLSSYSPQKLYFRPYNAQEITEILKDRCSKAFEEGVIDEEVVAEFGAFIYKSGIDLRTALKILLTAGRNAEGGKISMKDLKVSFMEVEQNIIKEIISNLNDTELLFTYAIAISQHKYRSREIEKNIVYKMYQNVCNEFDYPTLSWRHLSTRIATGLEKQGIIRSEVHGRGKGKGTATFFSIDDGVELDEIIKVTNEELKRRVI